MLRGCVPVDWGLHAGHGGPQRGHGPAAETEHCGGPESAVDSGVLGCWGWIGEASRCLSAMFGSRKKIKRGAAGTDPPEHLDNTRVIEDL